MNETNFKIKCPCCSWVPDGGDYWECVCGHIWNTFDTRGVCPSCKKEWDQTQCPVYPGGCGSWSKHDDWYIIPIDFNRLFHQTNKRLITKTHYLKIDTKNDVQAKCIQWFQNMPTYFEKYPRAFEHFKKLISNDQPRLDLAIEAMSQIKKGKGFSMDNPLEGVNVDGFYGLLTLLVLENIKRKSYYKFLNEGYIIDEIDVINQNDETYKLFNKIYTSAT